MPVEESWKRHSTWRGWSVKGSAAAALQVDGPLRARLIPRCRSDTDGAWTGMRLSFVLTQGLDGCMNCLTTGAAPAHVGKTAAAAILLRKWGAADAVEARTGPFGDLAHVVVISAGKIVGLHRRRPTNNERTNFSTSVPKGGRRLCYPVPVAHGELRVRREKGGIDCMILV